jgi:N,N'-diacetylchitobiose phosphorylase
LTGSGGWNYTAVTRWMLGVRLGFDGMIVDPCIPSDWKEFRVTRQWRGATYEITVKNPHGVQKGVIITTLDNEAVHGPIMVQPEGSVHEIVVVMG